MSAQHTPGPWASAVSDTHDGRLAIWADGGMAGVTQVAILPPEFGAVKANARLIAAAPDLLEALEAVVAVADRRTVEFDKAHAAIAKAKGRAT